MRLLSTGLVLLGMVLLGVSALQYLGFFPTSASGLIVDEPEREFPVYSAGQTSQVLFQIHNRTNRPVRVVGLTEC